MKIVFLDAATVADVPGFQQFYALGDFQSYDHTAPEQVIERLRGAEVAIGNKIEFTAEVIDQLPDLKLICIAATGTNNVDKEAAAARNIPVRNVAGYSTESVAQLTLTALNALSMDLLVLNDLVYSGEYSRAKAFATWKRPFFELKGKRYGIIGLGTIGHRVAELATAYGAEVVYHSTSGKNTEDRYPRLSLDELLATADAISIHTALVPATEGLISHEQLRRMKPTAYLLNLGRGGIVDEEALVEALNGGEIAGAAMDVFTTEPLPLTHVYRTVNDRSRLLLTPHIGWASVEAREALIAGIVTNIQQGW